MKNLIVKSMIISILFLIQIAPSGFAQEHESTINTTIDDQVDVSVTVYNSGTSLVRDVREINFTGGMVDLKFMDVASGIDPTSVHFISLSNPDGLAVWEQNYEYDLIDRNKLLTKYIGEKIAFKKFNEENKKYEHTEGVLLSIQGGYVIQIKDKIHLAYPGEIILEELPEGLITRPTLVWLLNSAQSSMHQVEMSYLTSGLNWNANYVAVINEDDSALDLNGWVTINNNSGAQYNNAKLKLIAGDVHRVRPGPIFPGSAYIGDFGGGGMGGGFEEKAFFEYHLYTLQRPATIKNNQQKQISLLEHSNIPAEKVFVFDPSGDYRYGGDSQKDKIQVKIKFMNSEKNGLGIPLPKGTVRVYKADTDGSLQLIGEDSIDHTPKDEEIRLFLGEAFDLVGERILKNRRKITANIWEYDIEIILRNHKDDNVVITVVDHARGDWDIISTTHDWKKKDAGTFEFPVMVKKDEELKIKYTVRREY